MINPFGVRLRYCVLWILTVSSIVIVWVTWKAYGTTCATVVAAFAALVLGYYVWNARLDAWYHPSRLEAVRRMLDIAKPRPGELLYDLGCGDGRLLIVAAR